MECMYLSDEAGLFATPASRAHAMGLYREPDDFTLLMATLAGPALEVGREIRAL